jgi:hypothetical protein
VSNLIILNETADGDVCLFCHVSAWFVGHRQDCKLHRDNLPEELR